MIADYEITHGMQAGKDYKIVAVIHSGGGFGVTAIADFQERRYRYVQP